MDRSGYARPGALGVKDSVCFRSAARKLFRASRWPVPLYTHRFHEGSTAMPQPIGRDLDETRAQLVGWLGGKLPEARGLRIDELRGPKDTGFSSDTLMFTLDYEEQGTSHRQPMVIRLKPAGDFGVFPIRRSGAHPNQAGGGGARALN